MTAGTCRGGERTQQFYGHAISYYIIVSQLPKAIPRADRELRPGIDSVCEKHFDESYFDRYFETKLPVG